MHIMFVISMSQKWSAELAQVAENYAKKCLWAHNPERTKEAQTMTSQFSYVGENLYVTSAGEFMTGASRVGVDLPDNHLIDLYITCQM